MATPGKLVQTVAEVLGIPLATVTQYDRQLADAGYRSKGGRGPSAAKVTAQDASNLLIAIVASPIAGPTVKIAARTCAIYGSLQERSKAAHSEGFAKFGLPTIGSLPPAHTLQHAVATLISSSSTGESLYIPERREKLEADFALVLEFDGPVPWAQIIIDGSLGEQKPAKMARFIYSTYRRGEQVPSGKGDLHQKRFVTYTTIRRLGSLLSEPNPEERLNIQ